MVNMSKIGTNKALKEIIMKINKYKIQSNKSSSNSSNWIKKVKIVIII